MADKEPDAKSNLIIRWFDAIVLDAVRQFRWTYLPPLMVYLAAGVAGLTAIVGTFFVKDYLGLSADALAALAFWAGLPWALKMPIGHLVDLWWRHKAWLVYAGATLIALGLMIMYGLIAHTEPMRAIMPIETWYVVSVLLAPTGYVIQDVVADAMTVEAVPTVDDQSRPLSEQTIKQQHTTMQTLGRVAIIGGSLMVAALNISLFSGVELMPQADKVVIYSRIYLIALFIPLISVAGVILGEWLTHRRRKLLKVSGHNEAQISQIIIGKTEQTKPNWFILGGSLVFAIFTVSIGLSGVEQSQEIVFVGAMAIVLFLMHRLVLELPPKARYELIGTALIIFVFRAIPSPGAGLTWFEIDVLGFDQQFLAGLSLITSVMTLIGMLVLRPLMATHSIAYVVVILTLAFGVLSLPNIGLFYGIHHWTASWSGGVIDARSIAMLDTVLESPLGQIAMIPMLAWIARSAPGHLKATFFAVMASFTNLALSAASLGTKYLNQWKEITREVSNNIGEATITADYTELGFILIIVTVLGLLMPLITVIIIQRTRWHTSS